MPRTTMADLAAQVAALTALVAAQSAPAAPVAASEHFRPGKRDANGNVPDGFPCTVGGGCTRVLKTDGAAASHDLKAPKYHVSNAPIAK